MFVLGVCVSGCSVNCVFFGSHVVFALFVVLLVYFVVRVLFVANVLFVWFRRLWLLCVLLLSLCDFYSYR